MEPIEEVLHTKCDVITVEGVQINHQLRKLRLLFLNIQNHQADINRNTK